MYNKGCDNTSGRMRQVRVKVKFEVEVNIGYKVEIFHSYFEYPSLVYKIKRILSNMKNVILLVSSLAQQIRMIKTHLAVQLHNANHIIPVQ